MDLFGIKARETANSHLMKIKDLESEIDRLNGIIQIQSNKIRAYEQALYCNVDYPNSKR